MNTNQILDALGGTSAVADMCGLTTGAVSQWRTSKNGIPKPWLKFFEVSHPELFFCTRGSVNSKNKDVLDEPL